MDITMNEPGLRFHHVGVVCRDLDQEERALAPLGYRAEDGDFEDPVQGVRGRFLGGAAPRLELLSPLGEGGVLDPWLKGGAKLYHLTYEADDMDGTIGRLRAAGARLVVKPVPATAFGGRNIAFLMLPNMLLIELISAK